MDFETPLIMDIPSGLMEAFPPSEEELLDLARRKMDDSMLGRIAGADYGHMADEMFAELKPIRDQMIIPAPMHWQLKEVLELTRWSGPEIFEGFPLGLSPEDWRAHQIRLFACTVLLRAAAEPANEQIDTASEATLAHCLVSARVLGDSMSEAAARFLTWRIPQMGTSPEDLLFLLGLLIVAARLRSGRISEALLGSAADWVIAEEDRYRQAFPWYFSEREPFLAFGIQTGCWRPLATELTNEAAAIQSADVREKIQLCELLLEPGW